MIQPMKRFAPALFLLLAATGSLAAEGPTLRCDVGPVAKVFGKTDWLAYSCSDRTSIVFIAAPKSVAEPHYFFLHRWNGKYQVQGEGNGDRTAVDAANAQIGALTTAQVSAIIGETIRAAAKPKAN
jgi:hypothetical protein